MSQITLVFGVAPAIAPVLGGVLLNVFGWRAVFWLLLALVIALLTWASKRLPETLPVSARQSLLPRHLWRNYVNVLRRPEFLLLGAIPALNFAAFFLYIAVAPSFLMDLLGVSSYGFAWLFVPMITGVMIGALISGRTAGMITPRRTIGLGYILMFIGVATDVGVAALVPPGVPWHVLPIMIYAMGSSVTMPSATLLLLDLFPTMRGLASSLQGFLQFVLAAVNAGTIAPILAGSLLSLALGMAGFTVLSLLLWITYLRHTR
jgi:DHA1 family bicyclomycin/chloramphenicol resistance-like MFS transporter